MQVKEKIFLEASITRYTFFVLSTADSEHVISTFNRPSHFTITLARIALARCLFGRNRVDNILALRYGFITRMNPHNDHSTSIH